MKATMKKRNSHWLKHLLSAITLVSVAACSSSGSSPEESDDGPFIMGTGVKLDGTTVSNKLYASNTVEMRSRSGDRFTSNFDNQGRFSFDNVDAEGPWLIRSNLGNGNYLYGIATNTSGDRIVQNVHSYSDAVVRNWYTSRALDVDAIFDSASANPAMPTRSDAQAIYNTLTSVVGNVIDNYDLSGVDLNEVEFAGNGTSVGQFILQNPVIHNEGKITIIIYDPDNQTQSVAADDVSLSTELSSPDTQSPSAPLALRALPSASDEITLVWDVASDNIGIANYAVYRNDTVIGTTPYPVFVDGGLTSGSAYSYNVVAIDAAGNESDLSLVTSAEPLANVDSTPPTTPSSVLIDTRRGSLDLTWTQTGINDVASFMVSRGTEPTNLPSYANVTSTFFFDEAVNAGVQYCYQISAVDASGNASASTGVVCATAPGSVVSTTTNTTPDPVEQPTGDVLTAPQVDVSNLACINEVPENRIETDLTLTSGCYLAPSGITIREPANLTLEPGAVIKFSANTQLYVAAGASLTARGSAQNPIVLTGLESTPGFWRGLEFNYSNSIKNELDHVQVEYAGVAANDEGGIHIVAGTTLPSRVSISNSTLRFNAGPGISLPKHFGMYSFDGNRLTGNATPVKTYGSLVELLDKRSVYTGNTLDAIVVDTTTIEAATSWPNMEVPYHSKALLVKDVFTIEAGTKIYFEENTGITVNSAGTLLVKGTQTNPVLLTGLIAQKASWEGLDFFYAGLDNRLEHVTIEYAGGGQADGAVTSTSSSSTTSRITFDNVTIANSAGYALDIGFSTVITQFDSVTLTGNDAVANVDIYAAQVFNNPGNYTGNVIDAIEIKKATVEEGPVVLSNTDIPYYGSSDFTVRDALTLEAGVTLQMESGARFLVNQEGALATNGTAANPVSIVGQQPIAGYWNGILFFYSNNPQNRLSHTLVADGGDGAGIGGLELAANVRFRCTSTSPTRVAIENSRIENSLGYGIALDDAGCLVTVDAGTTYSSNANGATN